MLQGLVLGDADGATGRGGCHGAAGAQGTARARFGVELHDGAWLEWLDFAGRATNRVRAHVDVEGGLGKELAVACDPRLAEDFAARFEHVLDEGAADVAAINVQLGDDVSGLVGHVIAQHGGSFFFGTIRGCDGAREDQVAVEVGGDMALVAVEPLARALSAVAHVPVFDRDAALRGNPPSDARAPTGRIGLEILLADLAQRREVAGQGRLVDVVGQMLQDRAFERVDLLDEIAQSLRLRLGVAPLGIEGALDAAVRCEQRRSPRVGDESRRTVEQRGYADNRFARSMGQQIEGIFDAARALERHRVHRDAQLLGQPLPVELLGATRQLDGALQESAVHVVLNEPCAKRAERSLRERGLGRAEHIEHELPAQVDDGHLHGLCVGDPLVALQQHDHCEEGRRHRLFPRARVSVHRLQLVLKLIIEQLATMQAQEAEQLPRPRQPLHQKLLLPRERHAREPSHRCHRLPPKTKASRRRAGNQGDSRMITYDHVWSTTPRALSLRVGLVASSPLFTRTSN